MLHKSFKPAKCKTALKLAASRIKLLKNKREAQLRQLKREVAQLLAAGQDQTARIRVEHVVREEKTMAAYELIEIYCELIAARLPIIESQKNCPIDLKEAVTSVIFASPRCADIPELTDVRKHLSAKYGKEFASSALEVRPDCGVSRLLVEKLSVKAPDGPTKIKILTAIAEEHNVKWDPSAFEEKNNPAPSDLLNGPSSFQGVSNTSEKLPPAQQPVNYSDNRPSDFQAAPRKDDTNSNPHGLDSRPSAQSDRSNDSFNAGTTRPDASHSGGGVENAEYRNSDQYASGFSSRQNWPMEFKDATSAAQAAAEAAERASMAARAAADLSSLGRNSRHYSEGSNMSPTSGSGDQRRQDIMGSMETNQGRNSRQNPEESKKSPSFGSGDQRRQDITGSTETNRGRNNRQNPEESKKSPTFGSGDQRRQDITGSTETNRGRNNRQNPEESKKSPTFGSGDQRRQDMTGSTEKNQHLKKGPVNSSSGANPQMHYDLGDGEEQDDLADLTARFYNLKSTDKTSSSAPSKSSSGSVENSSNVNNSPTVDKYSQNTSSEAWRSQLYGGARESSQYDSNNGVKDGIVSGNIGSFEETDIRTQHSSGSSLSPSGSVTRDHNILVDHHKPVEDIENPFAVDGNMTRSQEDTSSYQNDTAFFDDSGSEGDVINLDAIEEHNVHQPSSYFSPRRNMNDSKEKYSSQSLFASEDTTLFPEKTSHEVAFHSDAPSPVAFDESDGSGSENEEELPASVLFGSESTGGVLQKETVSSGNHGDASPISTESPAFMRASFERENEEPVKDAWLQQASHDLDDAEELNYDRHTKLSYGSSETRQPSRRQFNSKLNAKDTSHDFQVSESSSTRDEVPRNDILDAAQDDISVSGSGRGSGKELSFGKLSGGFKNKGYQHPPYVRKPSPNLLASKEPTADGLLRTMDQSFSSKSDGISGDSQTGRLKVNQLARSENTAAYSDSSDDSSGEQNPKQDLTPTQGPSNYKLASEGRQKAESRSFFDSDNSDAEEDHTEQNLTRNTCVGAARSLRTKAPRATPDRKSSSQSNVVSESPSFVNYDLGTQSRRNTTSSKPRADLKLTSTSDNNVVSDRRSQDQSTVRPPSKFAPMEPPSKVSLSTGVNQDIPSHPRVPEYSMRQKQKRSDEAAAASKPIQGPNRSSSREENTKSSAREEQSVAGQHTTPKRAERPAAPATSNSQGELPSTDSSTNKASHVHPKLPDYDALTAKLMALRQNRQ